MVLQIFDLCLSGICVYEIARTLNLQGIPTKGGSKWQCKCSDLRGSEQPAAFQEGIETSSPPGAKEGCQGHLAVGALP